MVIKDYPIKPFTHIKVEGFDNYQLERVDHPDGRYYLLGDEKFYSVTTVLDKDDGSLDAWRNRVGHAEADKITNRAAAKGNKLHKMCEDYLNNVADFYSKADSISKYRFDPVYPILRDRVDNVIGVEKKLFSRKLRVAGTTDLIADFDNEISIIDHKGSVRKKKAEWIEGYFVQMAIYADMVEERTGLKIENCVNIIAVDDDTPQIFKTKKKYWIKEAKKRINEYYGKLGE